MNLKETMDRLTTLKKRLNMYADRNQFVCDIQKEIHNETGNRLSSKQIWEIFDLLGKRIETLIKKQ